MDFKDIEEAVLAALNITSKLKDPELTTAIQSILDKCVAYREEQNLEAPGVLNKDKSPLDNMDSPEDNNFPLPSLMNNPEVNSILGEWEKVPEDEEHFGEEQAEGLDNLLEGLRDTPHDDRW